MADLRNTRLSIFFRNRLLDAIGLEDFDGALIRCYSGAQPATPETAIGAQVLLVTMTMNAEGFPDNAAAGGAASANPITAGLVVANGNAAWFRVLNAAGTQVLCDGSIGPSGDGNQYNLTLPTIALVIGVSIGAQSMSITIPMQGT